MSEERKQINYAVACVSEFARKHNLTIKEAFQFLFEHRAIEFLRENYDIEHTLPLEDALDDISSQILRQDYILKVPHIFMAFFKMKEILGI